MLSLARKTLRRILLGNADLPQQCSVAMSDPQSEVEVSLHGIGSELNVTNRHVIACACPSTLVMGLESEQRIELGTTVRLRFHERGGSRTLLGQLVLQNSDVVRTGGREFHLFEVRSCKNYCQPRPRLFAYYLFHAWLRARNSKENDVEMTALAANAMTVLFSCPRPVVLVSVEWAEGGNIFPMNLMGHLGDDYFGFALNSRRRAAPQVESAGRVALSSIPFDEAALARQLGKNHRQEAVNWGELPFPVTRSRTLGIPVPAFATRVRELEIEAVRKLGTHTLFVARIIRDERWSDSPQFFMIHGLYQSWRRSVGRVPDLAGS
jgi:flavin reductase (DIM6/NTAB) family NADH-FMN oxidoreductase RutF